MLQFDEVALPGQPSIPPSTTPDPSGFSEVDYLVKVNDLQSLLDAASRKLMQWSLLSVWWDYISDPNSTTPAPKAKYQGDAANIET